MTNPLVCLLETFHLIASIVIVVTFSGLALFVLGMFCHTISGGER